MQNNQTVEVQTSCPKCFEVHRLNTTNDLNSFYSKHCKDQKCWVCKTELEMHYYIPNKDSTTPFGGNELPF